MPFIIDGMNEQRHGLTNYQHLTLGTIVGQDRTIASSCVNEISSTCVARALPVPSRKEDVRNTDTLRKLWNATKDMLQIGSQFDKDAGKERPRTLSEGDIQDIGNGS